MARSEDNGTLMLIAMLVGGYFLWTHLSKTGAGGAAAGAGGRPGTPGTAQTDPTGSVIQAIGDAIKKITSPSPAPAPSGNGSSSVYAGDPGTPISNGSVNGNAVSFPDVPVVTED